MFRVFSGRIRPDAPVYNATQGVEERIGQLFALRGKEHEPVSEVSAGDIGAVAKLQHTHTGDTFSTKDAPVQLAPIELPEPLLKMYDRVRAVKGTGAALLRARRCGACRLELDRSAISRIASTPAEMLTDTVSV